MKCRPGEAALNPTMMKRFKTSNASALMEANDVLKNSLEKPEGMEESRADMGAFVSTVLTCPQCGRCETKKYSTDVPNCKEIFHGFNTRQ